MVTSAAVHFVVLLNGNHPMTSVLVIDIKECFVKYVLFGKSSKHWLIFKFPAFLAKIIANM
jgi:hypothetical protein